MGKTIENKWFDLLKQVGFKEENIPKFTKYCQDVCDYENINQVKNITDSVLPITLSVLIYFQDIAIYTKDTIGTNKNIELENIDSETLKAIIESLGIDYISMIERDIKQTLINEIKLFIGSDNVFKFNKDFIKKLQKIEDKLILNYTLIK